jgi:Glycosyl hydrolase family 26
MGNRLVLLVASVITLAAIGVAGTRFVSPASGSGVLPVEPASYLGVYETGPPGTYQPVTTFTQMAGQQPNLVGYYSGWWEAFQKPFAETVHRHGAVTIMQWDPTATSVSGIADGEYDDYLRSFADSVRSFGQPVVIGFGHEMNANWYSWGYGHLPAPTFVAAWRHIVTLFRGQHANNVTWLWTLQADEAGTGPIASWWPGSQYVTWVGIDGYYYRPSDTFFSIFGQTIAQVRGITGKPVLLSETAVGPGAGKAAKIPGLFAGMRHYGTLGLVWFDIAQDGSIYSQDWRIENSPAAESAFRSGVSTLKLASP